MNGSFSLAAGLLAGVMILGATKPAFAGVVGTFDTTRASTANVLGALATDAIASLNANFSGTTYATAPTLTSGFLAGVDVLLITPADTETAGITPLSSAEQTALLNFVEDGGRAFLIVDGYSPYAVAAQSMLNPFGMTISDDGLIGTQNVTPTTNVHPVINGPFGETTSISMSGAGLFTNLGLHATSLATMDATGLPVLAAIEADALGPGSGRVVLITDATSFVNDGFGGFFSGSETLFLNTLDYLQVPEPGGLALATCAAAGIGIALALRSCRRPTDVVARNTRGGTE